MPNWVKNTLKIIKGDPQEVFAKIRTEESVFDFNTLVPMPEMPEHIETPGEDVALARPAVPAWYVWSVEHWGTKWNARCAQYSTKDPQHVIWFDTAWAPPAAIFESLAQHFPAHEIVIYSDEYNNHFHGTCTIVGGHVAWASDPCQCFDEDMTGLSNEELAALGIEEAP